MSAVDELIAPPMPALSPETLAYLSGVADKGLFIGGQWLPPHSGETIEVLDPSTGAVIAHVASGGAEDIDKAVARARTAFDHGPWPGMGAAQRSAILLKIADLIEANVTLLSELEVLDNGMQLTSTRGVVSGAAGLFRYYAGWCGKVYGESSQVDSWDPSSEITAFTRREPLGVVGQILPWNFPLAIGAMKMAPALAAGCTVVLKPAEETSLSILVLADLCKQAGLPDGVLSVISGYGETAGAALTAHPDVDKISFTGSTEVGKLILAAAAGNLKKVSLELGGKAPFIVFPDADLDKVAVGIVRGAFGNQGQNCVAAPRIYLHADIAEEVTRRVVEQVQALEIGPGMRSLAVGPLISRRHLDRVMSYVEIGKDEGAVVAVGGEALDGDGYFMQPTVFTGVTQDMRIMREEIFGPVTCLQTFDTLDLDDVAALANDTPYGLVASVWTRDLTIAHRLVNKIKAGTVTVNGHGHPGINAPFGGYKQSGWGREFGKAAIDMYLETKTIAIHV